MHSQLDSSPFMINRLRYRLSSMSSHVTHRHRILLLTASDHGSLHLKIQCVKMAAVADILFPVIQSRKVAWHVHVIFMTTEQDMATTLQFEKLVGRACSTSLSAALMGWAKLLFFHCSAGTVGYPHELQDINYISDQEVQNMSSSW